MMRGLLIAAALMILTSEAYAQGVAERARVLVGYLNGELAKSRYKSMSLHNETCADVCVYSLTKTSLVEVAPDRIRIVANIESPSRQDDFSEDMKAATYLFSLVLWGNMSSTASYEDANVFLRDLLQQSSQAGVAIASTNNWTYGVVHIKCFGPSTMLIALNTLKAPITDVGEHPARCQK